MKKPIQLIVIANNLIFILVQIYRRSFFYFAIDLSIWILIYAIIYTRILLFTTSRQ